MWMIILTDWPSGEGVCPYSAIKNIFRLTNPMIKECVDGVLLLPSDWLMKASADVLLLPPSLLTAISDYL